MRLFLGARMPRLAQLRFAAPLAAAQARSARPLRRSFRRHFAQCLGGLELNEKAKKPAGGEHESWFELKVVKRQESSGILGQILNKNEGDRSEDIVEYTEQRKLGGVKMRPFAKAKNRF